MSDTNFELTPGCICQDCGKNYTVDLIIPDKLWEEIKPPAKPEGAGLLCGACIMARIELVKGFARFDCLSLGALNIDRVAALADDKIKTDQIAHGNEPVYRVLSAHVRFVIDAIQEDLRHG